MYKRSNFTKRKLLTMTNLDVIPAEGYLEPFQAPLIKFSFENRYQLKAIDCFCKKVNSRRIV